MFFKKYTALGNVYIIIDPNKCDFQLSVENIQKICNHYVGLGSDGIVYGPIFEENAISCKIFNPDGSEAEKSGNGTRIFAQYLLDTQYIGQESVSVEVKTKGGVVKMYFLDKHKRIVESEIAVPSFLSKDIAIDVDVEQFIEQEITVLDRTFKVSCVSVGNPHCVVILDDISENLARKYGPYIENMPIFKNRINVQFVKLVDRSTAFVEIWERGAGYTMSSGTSSAAVCAVLNKLNYVDDRVLLKMPGGDVVVKIDQNSKISILGSVDPIAVGDLLLSL